MFRYTSDQLSNHLAYLSNLNMPSWRDDYLSALHERDKKEKANRILYDSCLFGTHESITPIDKMH